MTKPDKTRSVNMINIIKPIPIGRLINLKTTCIEANKREVVFPNMCNLISVLYSLTFRRFKI